MSASETRPDFESGQIELHTTVVYEDVLKEVMEVNSILAILCYQCPKLPLPCFVKISNVINITISKSVSY